MSADSGLWDVIAGWLTRRGGVRLGGRAQPEPTQWALGQDPSRPGPPGWEVQPLGRKITLCVIITKIIVATIHGVLTMCRAPC